MFLLLDETNIRQFFLHLQEMDGEVGESFYQKQHNDYVFDTRNTSKIDINGRKKARHFLIAQNLVGL